MQRPRTQTIDWTVDRQTAALKPEKSLWLCLSAIALTLLLLLATAQPLFARHAPTRHDRRPDRESRIRYPSARSRPSTSQRNHIVLHSAPASQPAPATSPGEEVEANATPDAE